MLTRAIPGCVAILALTAAGCDTVPLVAPTRSSVTLTAASSFVPPGGTTEVTAFVAESSGTPVHNGTTVRFATNLGRIEPVETQTRNGYATATFVAGDTAGVADVRATSGGIGGGTGGDDAAATNMVQITVGGAAATAVLVSASPSSVPAGGGTVTIVASVVDENGNRLRNVPVSFSADRGALSATFATTDTNGEARVQVTTSQETVVTARAGAAEAATVTITVDAGVTIEMVGATTTNPIQVRVTPGQGSPATKVVVDFGDGDSTDLGAIRSATVVSHQYSAGGTYPIRVTQTNQDGSVSTAVLVVVIP